MTRMLIDGDPMVDASTSWTNPQQACAECSAPASQVCQDQCPAAIAAELVDEADLQVEAAYGRAGAAA